MLHVVVNIYETTKSSRKLKTSTEMNLVKLKFSIKKYGTFLFWNTLYLLGK